MATRSPKVRSSFASRPLSIEAFEAMVERDPAMILVLDAGFGGATS